jgi:hypothetical protein
MVYIIVIHVNSNGSLHIPEIDPEVLRHCAVPCIKIIDTIILQKHSNDAYYNYTIILLPQVHPEVLRNCAVLNIPIYTILYTHYTLYTLYSILYTLYYYTIYSILYTIILYTTHYIL